MKDRIISSYLSDFVQENYLNEFDESEAFEYFVNYCLISNIHPEIFDFDKISCGGGNDIGLDGIAILVNDHIVYSKEEIDFFKKSLHRLDVQFVFIQSKTSDRFACSDIGNFLFGVENFFNPPDQLKINEEIKYLQELKEYIYDSSIDMDRNPDCQMYYVTTGKWKNDSNVLARVEASVTKLKSTDLFRDIIFSPVDSERLKKIYRELKHKIENEILFERHTILPTMEKVREAYIGIIPVSEFMKIIMDEDGNLRKHLFYDNVRDYQGNNSVNREISETLKDSVQNDKFALMNNGLTIVAKSINKVGAKFKLKDYQIVNGCQTTHVLFRNRDFLNDQVYLPIKLIVTDDIETTNLIIKATNRQTEVKIEAFESLSPFHKKLEEFYTTFGATRNPHLYYERRSKQYDHLPIGKNYIISLTAQVKSFISMFLNEPQSTHRYYGELLNSYRNRIFVENHSPFPYYLSGYAYNKVERYFAENKLNRRYKKFKYHLLLLFRLQSEPFNVPFLDSKKIDSYCDHLLRELSDEEKSLLIFKKSIKLIDETVKQAQISYNASTRRRAFTERLLNQLNGKQTLTSAKVRLMEGSITSFSRVKGYGLIRSKNIKEDIIFYNHDLSSADVDGINLNSVVKFNLVENSVGSFAKNITILKE